MSTVTILGIDIYPHYSTKYRRYAVTILHDGVLTKQYPEISRTRLLRLIAVHEPEYLAIDNIFELASNIKGIHYFFSRLPAHTRVIQTTGTNTTGSLQKIASQEGLPSPSKLSPLEESASSARLVEQGVGAEARVLKDETKIIVSRNVSLGPGGSSQNRYRRKIHGSILNIAKKIEASLQKMDVDYDLFSEKSDFGLDRASFHVYATRTKLNTIKSFKDKYIKVRISPIFNSNIEFVPLSHPIDNQPKPNSGNPLIIGVDPGTNCGLAILTIDAYPLYLQSRKQVARGDLTQIVISYGSPLIVAADTSPAPQFVQKLAKMVNAVLFTPESVLEVSEKRAITREYATKHSIKVKNSHIRDALAAAVKAHHHYKNKFQQVEKEVHKTGLKLSVDNVKILVVRGHPISNAIEQVSREVKKIDNTMQFKLGQDIEQAVSIDYERKIQDLQKKVTFYREQVRQLKDSNDILVTKEKQLGKKISTLTRTLAALKDQENRLIKKDREHQKLKTQIETLRRQLASEKEGGQQLREKLETIRSFKKLELKGDVVFIKPVESFTREGLEKTYQLYDIKRGDTIILLDASGGGTSTAKELIKRGIKAIISSTPMSHQAENTFAQYGVFVIPDSKIGVEWVDGYPYVRSDKLHALIKEITDSTHVEESEKIESLIQEYKKERRRTTTETNMQEKG